MARKSSVAPEEINEWFGRIKRAEKVRKEADEKFGYSRASQEYQGDYESAMPSFMADVNLVPINEVYAYGKTFVPSVYSRDPYLTVNPMGFKSIAPAKIKELMVNADWRSLNLKREVKRCILDGIHAEGWIKCGYTSVFGSIEPEDGKPGLESSEYIKDQEIFATRISWRNMVRDPDATNGLHDARWVAQNIIKPLEAVKASGLYDNTGNLEPSFVIDYNERKGKPSRFALEDAIPYVSLWEIWDHDLQKVYTISEGSTKFLMNKKWPYEMDGYPYELLRFNENPDEVYAPNLIGSWEPQLWEKIKLRAMQLDHIKRFNRQLSVEEGAMTPAEIQKLTLGRTGSVTKRKKGFDVPMPIPYPPLQADIYGVEGRVDLDKDNISGQPNAVRSAPQKTQSRTLGEIDRLISSFSSRQTEPQDVIEDFCEGIAKKLIALNMQFLSGEKWVRATQKDIEEIQEALIDPNTGASRFDGTGFKFTKADIQGSEYEVDVRSGSTLPLDRQNRIESLSMLLKLGPTLGIQPGGLVARTLGKALISEFELKEVEAAFEEEQRQIDALKAVASRAQEQNVEQQELRVKNMKAAGAPNAM